MPTITELTDLEATHVSYVHKGANKKEFFLMKSDDSPPVFQKEFDLIINKSDEKKLVYGVVYEPDAIDTQNEFAKAEAIESAAHKFLSDSRNVDLQHNFQTGFGTVVESYIAPADFKISNQEVKKGSWVLVTKATDEVWRDIKKGEITGYSMAGKATKTLVADNKIIKEAFDNNDVKSFFNTMKNFFSVTKEEKPEKPQKEKGEIEMEREELQELIKDIINEEIASIAERLSAIEGQIDLPSPEEADSVVTKQDMETIIKWAVADGLKPISSRISNIEKARGISRQNIEEYGGASRRKSVFSGVII